MASIDAFLDFAVREPPAQTARASLRRLRPHLASKFQNRNARERTLILAVVILMHALLFFALRAAMRPPAVIRTEVETPFQITIIERSPKPRITPPPVEPRKPHADFARVPTHGDALRAVEIAPRQETPASSSPGALQIYDARGALRVPPTAVYRPPTTEFARHFDSRALPGMDSHGRAPEVRAGPSPQKIIEGVGALLFGGGAYDPCPGLEADALNTDDPDRRDEDLERMQRACSGR